MRKSAASEGSIFLSVRAVYRRRAAIPLQSRAERKQTIVLRLREKLRYKI